MSTHIHNLSCSRRQTSTIYHVHILAMSTHIHDIMLTSTDIHHSSCSHTGHVYTHPRHHVDINRHPPFIVFTHWPCLHTSTIHYVHIDRHPQFIMLTHWPCLHTSTIHYVHIDRHPQFIMFTHWPCLHTSTTSCSHRQTSTMHHVHTLAMSTHIHNSSCSHTGHVYTHPHHVHIDRHPPCIMFTHWPRLQTSRNTKYPQLPDQNCSPFHILTNRFTFQVHYPGGMKMTRTNMRSVTLCHASRQ